MFRSPAILLLLFPLLEIVLLVQVGGELGFWWTLASLIAAGVVGAHLAKREGMRTLTAVMERLAKGETPANEVADGVMILFAGLLFILPGYLSDILALFLLCPPCRALLRRPILHGLGAEGNGFRFQTTFRGSWTGETPPPPGGSVIDGEFTRHEEPDQPPRLPE